MLSLYSIGIFAALLTSQTADDFHSDAKGPSTVCDITAAGARDFPIAVRDSGSYSLLNQNDDYYAVISDDELTVWAFTMPKSSLPMAAVCTRRIKSDDGSISGQFAMRCDGDKEECDKVFVEWREYHDTVTVKRVRKNPK
ncbi:hypothetical protein [Sphingorhabdus sp. EL138]|uniref:hypothetical protein n=1 Tax=Sphingorhabdus sp. EL138 TaxID=2073156 RepID=UPI000D685FAD|nr:hypothetical protein [Sphingorhabdus sp. EL138]